MSTPKPTTNHRSSRRIRQTITRGLSGLCLLIISTAPTLGGVVISGGGLTLTGEGGAFESGNVAPGGMAFALNEIGIAPHAIADVNDEVYGNASSWIGASADSFVGINLGPTPVPLYKVAFGRDNLSNFTDRALGLYTLQFTTVANPNESTPEEYWTTIGTIDYQSAGGVNFSNPRVRHVFTFNPVTATGFRIKTASATDYIAIDEIELYGPPQLRLEHPPGTTRSMPARIAVWGNNDFNQNLVPTNLVQPTTVVAGNSRIAALDAQGAYRAWGNANHNLLTDPFGLTGIRAIAAGVAHHLLLKSDGSVAGFGTDMFGETTPPSLLDGVPVRAIAAGERVSLAVTETGQVIGWGDPASAILPVPTNLSDIAAIDCGAAHAIALRNDGSVVAWGSNAESQTDIPVGLSNVVAIAAGTFHNLAVRRDGSVVAWGLNDQGQRNVPAGLTNAVDVAAGRWHSMARRADGTVLLWGDNTSGQLDAPGGLRYVRAISAKLLNSAALYADPLPLDFVPSVPGQPATRVITLFNDGPGPMQIRDITLDNANGFNLDTSSLSNSLAPGASTSFSVSFLPADTNVVQTSLLIETDDPDTPIFEMALNGSTEDLVPPVINALTNITLFTTNIAGEVITFTPTATDNADNEPVVNSIPPSGSLFPVGATTVTVSAVDFAGNTSTASFVVNVTLPTPVLIESGGSFATNNLASGATAFAQDQAFFPTHRITAVNDGVYGNASSWIGVSPANFIGINLGATPVAVEQIAFGRDNLGNFGDRVQGVYTVQFTTTPNPDASTPASAWTSFGSIVYPGASPLPARRNRYAFQRVEATGIRLLIQTDSLPVAIDEIELYDYNPIPFIVIEQPAGNALVSGVSTNNFGTREAGSSGPTNTYTVRNAGGVLLNITSISTIGSNATDFSVTPAGGWPNLPTNSSTTFHVVFQPSGVGPRSATLRVQNSSSNEPVFDIHLTGISADTTPPVINIPSNQFVYITEGTGSVATFTLPSATDNSSLPPTVSTEPESGSFFPLGTNNVTITATDSVNNSATGTFAVIVRPRARIGVEAPAGSALTGAPPSFAFGSLLVGATTSQTFTLVNDGLAALAISGASVIGAHPAEFVLETSSLSPSIGVGGTSHFAVTFAPLAHGPRTATVRLVTDDPVTPFLDVALSGDGLDITPPVITPPAGFSVVAGSPTGGVRVFYPPITVTDDAILSLIHISEPTRPY